jgi:hypothetical protein
MPPLRLGDDVHVEAVPDPLKLFAADGRTLTAAIQGVA